MKPDTEMLALFKHYANTRQEVAARREAGLPQEEWTTDPILRSRRFCHNFRVMDYGSQYFIREILADSPDLPTTLIRAAMYRLTNEPEFWKYLSAQLGRMPSLEDFENGVVSQVLESAYQRGIGVFRGAYLISFGKESAGQLKHRYVAGYFYEHFHPDGEDSIWTNFQRADTVLARIVALQEASRIGPFLAQQIVTDLGYS